MTASRLQPFRKRPASHLAGFHVGILCLETRHQLVVGNAQNAASFRFPVLYEAVKNVAPSELMSGQESALPAILEAGLRLERCGVSAIVGACGSFANYQKAVGEQLELPVFMSILTQVPFLLGSLAARRKLGIVFASTSSFTPRVMKECGITDVGRIVAISADRCPAFEPIVAQRGELDSEALRLEVTRLGLDTLREHPEIGAWLLQCSDLPAYAHSLQRATGLPVFDICTLIEHLQAAAVRRSYLESL